MVKAEEEVQGLFAQRVGERLAAARKAQGLSLDDVVLRTRVPRRHLEMIEAGNHGALPAIPYSAGFVKTYGQTLGLDGAELARDFRQEVSQVEQVRYVPEPFQPADPARMPSRLLAFVALGVAILLAVGYMLFRGSSTPDDRASLAAGTSIEATAPVPPKASGQPAQAPPAQPMAMPPASAVVAITARQPVWVKIYDKGGPTLFQGEMAAGQRFEVPSNAVDPMIWTGRPQALVVSVGATAIPPLGSAEQTIRDVSLKRDALLARFAPVAPAPPKATPAAAPAAVP
jgi:transcriptional regulator with XRE-family HTH domain